MSKKRRDVSVSKLREEMGRRRRPEVASAKRMLSSGSTLLNLACTGRTGGCFINGKYYVFVGDSESGKTWLANTCLAEAAHTTRYDGYDLYYDDVEGGALMDIRHYFGKKTAKRLKAPKYDKGGNPVYSETIEDFYFDLDDALDRAIETGRPLVWIEDSMDALSSKSEAQVFDKQKSAHKTGREVAGSYGDGKAKQNAGKLRKIISKLKRTGSILIIICHSKEMLNTFGFGEHKTHSGGKSLKFYATLQIWSSIAKKLKKKVKTKDRKVGIISKVQVKKNRVTGKDRTVYVPIYNDYGIDDIGSCVDYLLEEGHWKKSKGAIRAKEFDFTGSRDELVEHIDATDALQELRDLVGKVWREIEDLCVLKRKPRYA